MVSLKKFINSDNNEENIDFDDSLKELLKRVKDIKNRGFVQSHRHHDTGIGKTFEDLLEIKENPLKGPDFGNIEIKTKRFLSESYVTLFTNVPDHPKGINSYLKDNYGYPDKKHTNLNVLHASFFTEFRPVNNLWGFRLKPDDENQKLFIEIEDIKTREIVKNDIYYNYDTLKKRIKKKLSIILYVEANHRINENNREEFKYTLIKVFYRCSFEKFLEFIKKNIVRYDIRIGSFKSGVNFGKPHDHGSGFRVDKKQMHNLFDYFIEIK